MNCRAGIQSYHGGPGGITRVGQADYLELTHPSKKDTLTMHRGLLTLGFPNSVHAKTVYPFIIDVRSLIFSPFFSLAFSYMETPLFLILLYTLRGHSLIFEHCGIEIDVQIFLQSGHVRILQRKENNFYNNKTYFAGSLDIMFTLNANEPEDLSILACGLQHFASFSEQKPSSIGFECNYNLQSFFSVILERCKKQQLPLQHSMLPSSKQLEYVIHKAILECLPTKNCNLTVQDIGTVLFRVGCSLLKSFLSSIRNLLETVTPTAQCIQRQHGLLEIIYCLP
ncbi:hypothetical protein EGR_00102 [Echinococcus granulosus]|uniref:Uncharacterized protein n=1 Tax=Echinococcus granulosus TaxID=6210 RepID=W6UU44_ECHGR|nr:hypothetical protein EGR_00102 [Echinococcus granulosus]EUB64833.1 hypothetical protein EGR_00102 [Echinococcus granulosus]